MQAIGTYWGWVTPSYTITVSPEEVNDLLLALKCLQKLSGYKNHRADAWLKLLESMNATDFGFDRISTEVFERDLNEVLDLEMAV